MDFTIERLVIKGLHKTRDYDIPIRDNRIVMVGVNGLGKTTVVNLLYLILSRQWERVLEYDFSSVVLTINGTEYPLHQEQELVSQEESLSKQLRTHLSRTVPRHLFQTLSPDLIDHFAALAVSHGKTCWHLNSTARLRLQAISAGRSPIPLIPSQNDFPKNSLPHLTMRLNHSPASVRFYICRPTGALKRTCL